ncbi:MAG: Mrr restriction system protein [Planctomycetes bacterium]|nr:Mrr restriction system protein [Planctomycetota bacterium]
MAKYMSSERIYFALKTGLEILRDMGGRARGTEVLAQIPKRITLTADELSLNESGHPRWETNVRFYSTEPVKAGWLLKSKGYWQLTEDGNRALDRHDVKAFAREANSSYKKWLSEQTETAAEIEEAGSTSSAQLAAETPNAIAASALERAQEDSRIGIDQRIRSLLPYQFQDLVEQLLTGMGYHAKFNAPPGKDGGVDLIAYSDPLGSRPPRIIVQVKHKPDTAAPVKDIRELEGVLRREGDIGLFVSSGGFTPDALREVRSAKVHIEAMDLDDLVDHWIKHYATIPEEGKALLPLTPVYFIVPD